MDHSVISVKWHVWKINEILAYHHHRRRSPAELPAATSLISRILANIFKGPAWCKHSLPPINAPLSANHPDMWRIHPSLLLTASFLGRHLLCTLWCHKGHWCLCQTALRFFPSQHSEGQTKHQFYQQAVNRGTMCCFPKTCGVLREDKVRVRFFTTERGITLSLKWDR